MKEYTHKRDFEQTDYTLLRIAFEIAPFLHTLYNIVSFHKRGHLTMKEKLAAISPNRIAQYLGKPAEEFTREDLIKFIEENGIEMVNFRFVAGDGRLKTLNFIFTNRVQLDRLLSAGERVDGSNLFSYIDAASSDLYVIPRYRTAFVNPFSHIPAVDILCSYYTRDGEPLPSAPEHIIQKAHALLKKKGSMTLEAMGELEYYVVSDKQNLYPITSQRGYVESSPFANWEHLRCEAMHLITQIGGNVKYGHSEVGYIREDSREMEQHEIEFIPQPIEESADQIVLARWILRMLGYKYGATISFAPKMLLGHAGSGLHIHMRLDKDGKKMMIEENSLSEVARKAIAGCLTLAPSLTAFGNTVPISYLRLVPHQEAPTFVCWGVHNRSALIRVPLGWVGVKDMNRDANPLEHTRSFDDLPPNQTIEFRCPDGSANVHLLLAGLAVAIRHGFEMEDSLNHAQKLYVEGDIFSPHNDAVRERLPRLPDSCWESADSLLKDRALYEKDDVFTPIVTDGITAKLKSYNDKDLSEKLYGKEEEIKKLVAHYFDSF